MLNLKHVQLKPELISTSFVLSVVLTQSSATCTDCDPKTRTLLFVRHEFMIFTNILCMKSVAICYSINSIKT